MSTLTVTAKGQVTLRKDILEHLGVSPGQQINVEKMPDGRIEVRAAPAADIAEVFNLLRNKKRPQLSIAQIDELSRQGWSGRIKK